MIENYINKIFQMDNLELMKQLPDNSIDLIYGDILYGTGKKFEDYNDNLWKTPQEAVEWYRPRLEEMYRILKNTGSIYLHMDYRLVHYIKVEMDKIFGIENFQRDIIWRIGWVSGFKSRAENWIRNHDNILFYTKSDKFTFNELYIPYPEGYVRRDGKKPKGKGMPIEDTWNCKPKKLIKRIIKASSNEGDVVFDPFMGSGTTLVVAKELNRNYIGCDIQEKAVKITKERLKGIS